LCITLDRAALHDAITRETGDPGFCRAFMKTRLNLFSDAPVFVSAADVAKMTAVVKAIETATRLPLYRDEVLKWAPEIARHDFGPKGVFMSYDFHLGTGAAKLIEVNTNAGGAFLNAMLSRAQRACCAEVEAAFAKPLAEEFEAKILRMFEREWSLQRRTGRPETIAIVDDGPTEQYLYPEFIVAERLLQKGGFLALTVDAAQLAYEGGRLTVDGRAIDLVYNRLVDFSLQQPAHAALRAAYLDDAVVVTPNPRHHALFADKRNLVLLSDPNRLREFGMTADDIAQLSSVPRTVRVTSDASVSLWESRKLLFFKPSSGYGSKAVYRGDKITKRVWDEILAGDYIAQDFAPPSERTIQIEGAAQSRKLDVRLYTYDGNLLLAAARLYQGQTTNFRTPGGGFAPVFIV
jgi:hypothetical protein